MLDDDSWLLSNGPRGATVGGAAILINDIGDSLRTRILKYDDAELKLVCSAHNHSSVLRTPHAGMQQSARLSQGSLLEWVGGTLL
jgi:hypothetical protein